MNELEEIKKEINDLKIAVSTLVELTKQRLSHGDKKLDDHEKRLRFLERYAFILIGIIGLESTLFNYLK